MHVELIDPREKLAETLGGYGHYLPPRNPAPVRDLLTDAMNRAGEPLNTAVWKVARRSVQWDQGPYRQTRRLRVGPVVIPAKLLGGDRNWYFVAVTASEAASKLRQQAAAKDSAARSSGSQPVGGGVETKQQQKDHLP
jgi:hypothetical protein